MLLNGPITVYDAHKRAEADARRLRKPSESTRLPALATIDRRMKILLGMKPPELAVYNTEQHRSGQTMKFYGFTFYGFLRSFRIPGGIALKNFKKIMEIWLQEPKFQFFVPRDEALQALKQEGVRFHLARFCQLTANMFGEAEDLLDSLGYDEPHPDEIVRLAMQFAGMKYDRRFLDTMRVLCRHVPTFGNNVRRYIDLQRASLRSIEKTLFRNDLRGDEA
jgi:hypothetical protein